MQEYTIHPLVVGMNETDQGVMTYLRDYGKPILLPIYVFYIKGGDKNILVDTGLEQFVVRDDVQKRCDFEILEFEDALLKFDLKPESIDVIIHTHLHNDHCENDYKCKNAEIYVQKKELEFFDDPHPIDHRYYSDVLDDLNVIPVDGDANIMDGIDVILTPGHTIGGQSVSINTTEGRAIITGFCCNEKNFPEKGPVIPPGVHLDVIDAFESVKKIKEMADVLIPLHDFSIASKSKIP
ncbi:N-acyl homoserine lactonase family protein [Desulfobacterales bacterium HSG16]|nr:N-acyl homoserine lactonase family protein [Desulfobacterales bacterium HSG16]